MYKSFYNLTRKPFETIPDTSFLWLGENHQEALSTLHYGILDNKGFLLLTGEKGTGKTSLISGLTKSFDKDVEWAVISNPGLERIDFYNEIARNFGIDKQFTSKVQFLIQFSHFLHKADDENKKVLLLIDQCHLLSQEMLEELRLLSNIEKSDAKLINIFFVGEPSFNDLLSQPKNRAVRQRLSLIYELKPLNQHETEDYIRHRLSAAGSDEKIFSAKAVQAVQSFSGGVPLKINQICDAALKIGAQRGEAVITPAIVETAGGKMDTSGAMSDTVAVEEPVVPRMAPVENQKQFLLGDDPDSKLTGFNLEEDKRGGWLKLALAGLALVVVVGYFFRPAETPVLQQPVAPEVTQQEAPPARKLPGSTPPAVSMLEENKEGINLDKAKELKTAILEKAYEEAGDAEKIVQESGVEVSTETVPSAVAKEEPVVEKQPASEAPAEVAQEKVVAVEESPAASETVAEQLATEEAPAQSEVVAAEPKKEAAEEAAGGKEAKTSVVSVGDIQVISAPLKKVVVEVDPASEPIEPRKVILPLMPNALELTATGRDVLKKFVTQLKAHPKATVLVKGYVSSNNDSPENLKLSEERAMNVYKMLLAKGVDPEQVEVLGMGIKEPIASNDTREGRTKNRRVEIVVINDGV